MSATTKENYILRKELAAVVGRNTDLEGIAAALAGVVGSMGGQLRGCADVIAQKDKEISSLTHLLSIYSGADSPSGKDPRGYEATKEFLAISKAYEASKKDGAAAAGDGEEPATGEGGEEPSKETPAKPCGGRPRPPGQVAHNQAGPHRRVQGGDVRWLLRDGLGTA